MTRLFGKFGRVILTLLLVAAAIAALVIVWRHYQRDPWTRDGIVQADVVKVSSDVSGLLTQLRVHDNQQVRRGDVLFTVDEQRYLARLAQANAAVSAADASIVSARADVLKAQTTLNRDLRDARRYMSLGDLVSQQERDQKVTAVEQDRASLAQAQASVGSAIAQRRQAEANRRSAQIDVQRSTVRASVDGYVTGMTLRPGNYIQAGAQQFALLDTNSFYVAGYFEETKLHRFALGQRARINLLGDDRPVWGHVDSLSAGITDRQQNPSTNLLPNVTPTFSWIRLAQRVPVRVVIDRVPVGLRLIAGRTATVTILPGEPAVAPRALPASSVTPNTAPTARPSSPPLGQQPGAAQ